MANPYPRPSPEWVERMQEFAKGATEAPMPSIFKLPEAALEHMTEAAKAFPEVVERLMTTADPAAATEALWRMLWIPQPGGAEGLAINRAVALKRLGRQAAEYRKGKFESFGEAVGGVMPEGLKKELKETYSFREFFKQAKKLEQPWWDPVEDIRFVEGLEIPYKGRVVKAGGAWSPGKREIALELYKPKSTSLYHEMLHARITAGEGSWEDVAKMKGMETMGKVLEHEYSLGRLEGKASPRQIYEVYDPNEVAAKAFEKLTMEEGMNPERAFKIATESAWKKSVELVQRDLPEVWGNFMRRLPAGVEDYYLPKFPERPPIRGGKTGMKLLPQGKEAMNKVRRGETTWMEQAVSLKDIEPELRQMAANIPEGTKDIHLIGGMAKKGRSTHDIDLFIDVDSSVIKTEEQLDRYIRDYPIGHQLWQKMVKKGVIDEYTTGGLDVWVRWKNNTYSWFDERGKSGLELDVEGRAPLHAPSISLKQHYAPDTWEWLKQNAPEKIS